MADKNVLSPSLKCRNMVKGKQRAEKAPVHLRNSGLEPACVQNQRRGKEQGGIPVLLSYNGFFVQKKARS